MVRRSKSELGNCIRRELSYVLVDLTGNIGQYMWRKHGQKTEKVDKKTGFIFRAEKPIAPDYENRPKHSSLELAARALINFVGRWFSPPPKAESDAAPQPKKLWRPCVWCGDFTDRRNEYNYFECESCGKLSDLR